MAAPCKRQIIRSVNQLMTYYCNESHMFDWIRIFIPDYRCREQIFFRMYSDKSFANMQALLVILKTSTWSSLENNIINASKKIYVQN